MKSMLFMLLCIGLALSFHAQSIHAADSNNMDQRTVSAFVISEIDSQPIKGARIYNTKQNLLGVTDKGGRFEVELSSNTDSIVIISLGHKDRTISVLDLSERYIILKSSAVTSRSVDVISFLDAKDIIPIISHKLALSKLKHDTISYSLYTSIDFGEGSTRQNQFYSDVIAKVKCIPSSKSICSVDIVASRSKGFRDSTYIFDGVDDLIDITSETINVLFKKLLSPLSTNAFSYYTYTFLGDYDSLNPIRVIQFRPAHGLSPGFVGSFSYHVEDYSLTHITMYLVNGEETYVDSAIYDLDFSNTSVPWLPRIQTIDARASFGFLFGTIDIVNVAKGKWSVFDYSYQISLPEIDSSTIAKLDSFQTQFYTTNNRRKFLTEKGFRLYSNDSEGVYLLPVVQRTIPDNWLLGAKLSMQLLFISTDMAASIGKLKTIYGHINTRFYIGDDSSFVTSLRVSHSPEILQQNPIDRNIYDYSISAAIFPSYFTYTLITRFSVNISFRTDRYSPFLTVGYTRFYQYGDPQNCSECFPLDNTQSRVSFYNIGLRSNDGETLTAFDNRYRENYEVAYQGGLSLATEQTFHQIIIRADISKNFLRTQYGNIRYSLNLYSGVSSDNTPAAFSFFMSPRIPFAGSDFDVLTIQRRSVVGRAINSMNASLDFGRNPYRILGIKQMKGGLPALALSTGVLSYVSGNSPLALNNVKTHFEVGGSISNIPLGLIDILRVKIDFRWGVGFSAIPSTRFGWSATFVTPFD